MVWLGTGCFSPLCTFALYTQNAHRMLTGQVNWMNESVVSWKTSSLIFSSLFAYMIRLYINSDVQNPIFVCVPQKKLKNSNPGSGWAEVYEPESIFDRNGKKKKKKRRGHSAWSCVMNNFNVLRKKSWLFWLWMPTWETSVSYVFRPGATAHSFIF